MTELLTVSLARHPDLRPALLRIVAKLCLLPQQCDRLTSKAPGHSVSFFSLVDIAELAV